MEITFDPQFLPLVNALEANDAQRVWRAVERYQQEPDTPGLNLEQLKGAAGRRRLCTIRASQELRVLFARAGPTLVFLRAGHHDAIYRLADRVAFAAPLHGKPGLIAVRRDALDLDGSPVTPTSVRSSYAPTTERSILAHWTDSELAEAGFDADAIGRLRRATEETLLEVWWRTSTADCRTRRKTPSSSSTSTNRRDVCASKRARRRDWTRRPRPLLSRKRSLRSSAPIRPFSARV